MALKVSNRSDIPNFRALAILSAVNERIEKGEDIIRLEAGQPCFGAPQPALDFAKQVLDNDGKQGYTAAIGMPLLRDRIALHYENTYGVKVDYNDIALSVGSSSGFILTFLAAFEAGDKIGLTMPTYPAYRNILQSLDLEIVEIETTAESNYQPTAEILEAYAGKLDGLIINSPANPTGAILKPDTLQGICTWCDENGVRLISDEAYHGIIYEEPAETALKYSKNVIVLNTFSKYFAMTGWRLGWAVLPADLTDRVKKLAESLFVSPPTLSQHVAYKVFDHTDILDSYVAQYRQNRDILKAGLPSAGFDQLSSADGAFYIYADIHKFTNDSEAFCARMIDEAGVSTTPGLDFDVNRGNATMRISYAGTPEDMEKVIERLTKWQGK
jgi:aspartate/methionine/tyrosine aminotransferase